MTTPDFDNVVGGPCQVQLADAEVGHTAGGVTSTITPQNRARTVDQFGNSEVAIIHQGDQVRCAIPWAEWTVAVLAEIYEPGADNTGTSGEAYMGIGRSAGYIYTTQDLKIIPRLTADAQKRLQFYRATPIGELQLAFNNDDDRIFQTEFAGLVDESKDDGELIGKINVTTS